MGKSSRKPAPASRTWLRWVLVAAIVGGGAWAYSNSFGGALVFDDFAAIVHNPNIQTLWPLTRAMSAPRDLTVSGRPVASLTLAINYALAPPDARDVFEPTRAGAQADPAERFERNVWGYHFLNLAIHLMAGLALFGVVRRTLLSHRLRSRFGSAASGLAFAIALVWVVHPLQTEAVTYIVQRVESLMGLFVLLALYCAIRAADGPRARLWSAGAIASAALGVATKEVAATTLVLVMLWDWSFLAAPSEEPERQTLRWRDRWPLYAGLAATTCVLLAIVTPGARSRSVGLWLDGWSPWTYLLTESGVLLHYLRLTVWPSPLVLDLYWPMAHTPGTVAGPLAVVSLLFVLTVVGVWRRHPLGFIGAWFFVILAPTSSVLPIVTEVAAEHRMYLPLAAVVAFIVIGVYVFGRFLLERATVGGRSRIAQAISILLLLAVTIILGLLTRARNLDYTSDEGIWRDTVAKQPDNPRARTALGADLVIAGRYAEAEAELQKAVALDPARAEALSNLGAAEYALGKIDASIVHLERALALRPEYTDAHRNLAESYIARRQDALAVPHFRRVLEERPDHVAVLNHFALILAASPDDEVRNGALALELAERAATLTSRRDVASLSVMAAALAELDRFDEAVAALREAIALSSDNPRLVAELSRRMTAYAARRKVRLSAR